MVGEVSHDLADAMTIWAVPGLVDDPARARVGGRAHDHSVLNPPYQR